MFLKLFIVCSREKRSKLAMLSYRVEGRKCLLTVFWIQVFTAYSHTWWFKTSEFERNLDNKYYTAGLYYTLIIHGNSYLLGEEISQYLLFFPLIRNIIGTGKKKYILERYYVALKNVWNLNPRCLTLFKCLCIFKTSPSIFPSYQWQSPNSSSLSVTLTVLNLLRAEMRNICLI